MIVDETQDALGDAMTVILAGVLDGEWNEKPFLLDIVDMESANNKTIQQAVIACLTSTLGSDFDFGLFRLFLTDGAAYCLKAGIGLKVIFPSLLHVTCLSHGLNRIADLVRIEYQLVDQFLAEVKRIYTKCSRRRKEFIAHTQLALPPTVCLT